MGTDCTGCCKFIYNTITTTTTPQFHHYIKRRNQINDNASNIYDRFKPQQITRESCVRFVLMMISLVMPMVIIHVWLHWRTNCPRIEDSTITSRLGTDTIFSLIVYLMMHNATFNNISVIPKRSVLLVEETGGPEENHIMLYISPWSRFELTTSVVIGTDCIGSCKSYYHAITASLIVIHVEDIILDL